MSTNSFVPECTKNSYSWRAWDKSFVLQVPQANGSAVRVVAHCRRRCRTFLNPARRAPIKRATSRVFCYFRSILCEKSLLYSYAKCSCKTIKRIWIEFNQEEPANTYQNQWTQLRFQDPQVTLETRLNIECSLFDRRKTISFDKVNDVVILRIAYCKSINKPGLFLSGVSLMPTIHLKKMFTFPRNF